MMTSSAKLFVGRHNHECHGSHGQADADEHIHRDRFTEGKRADENCSYRLEYPENRRLCGTYLSCGQGKRGR